MAFREQKYQTTNYLYPSMCYFMPDMLISTCEMKKVKTLILGLIKSGDNHLWGILMQSLATILEKHLSYHICTL